MLSLNHTILKILFFQCFFVIYCHFINASPILTSLAIFSVVCSYLFTRRFQNHYAYSLNLIAFSLIIGYLYQEIFVLHIHATTSLILIALYRDPIAILISTLITVIGLPIAIIQQTSSLEILIVHLLFLIATSILLMIAIIKFNQLSNQHTFILNALLQITRQKDFSLRLPHQNKASLKHSRQFILPQYESTEDCFNAFMEFSEQIQKKVNQKEKLTTLGYLIAGIGHEINTPLGSIQASSESIQHTLTQIEVRIADLLFPLTAEQRALFFSLASHTADQQTILLPSRQRRAIRKSIQAKLQAANVSSSTNLAEDIVNLGMHQQIDQLIELFSLDRHQELFILLYDLVSQKRNLTHIISSVNQAAKIVKALKYYTHGSTSMDRRPIDILEGIETILTLNHSLLKQGIEVELEIDQKRPLIYADADQMNQIWNNLIQNAAHAMQGNGQLLIRLKRKTHPTVVNRIGVQVDIQDSGTGIAHEDLSSIFEPFFTTKPIGEGTGLGLDICKQIVNTHEGEIWVESTPGITCFKVWFPSVVE